MCDASGSLDVGLVTLAIIVGLVVGKFLGIFLFTFLSVKLRISPMPDGMTISNLAGTSLLGGIGFTVSLFIANLSFAPPRSAQPSQIRSRNRHLHRCFARHHSPKISFRLSGRKAFK